MEIISADSSGIILQNSDVWFVAVRRTDKQKHTGVHISHEYQVRMRIRLQKNWVEKLSAILYYKVIKTLLEESDCIQIDKDFLGKRARFVLKYLEILFLVYRQSSPTIEFLSERKSRFIKEAHVKTKAARYKTIKVDQDPIIDEEVECLKNYKLK